MHGHCKFKTKPAWGQFSENTSFSQASDLPDGECEGDTVSQEGAGLSPVGSAVRVGQIFTMPTIIF